MRFVISALICVLVATGMLSGLEARPSPPAVVSGANVLLDDVARGEVLLVELGCVNCHRARPGDGVAPPRRGPRLDALASRLRPSYVRAFLQAPHATEPGTVMPDVLPVEDRELWVEALVGRLFPQTSPPAPVVRRAGDLEEGRRLYHTLGCVLCHAAEVGMRPAALPERAALPVAVEQSVPLADLSAKYRRGGLVRFLEDPLAVRPSGRMPSLHLSPSEAEDLAAYLQREPVEPESPRRDSPPASSRLAARVGALLGKCATCHEGVKAAEPFQAPGLAELEPRLDRGCLSATPSAAVYPLSPPQRAALRVALAHRRIRGAPPSGTHLDASLTGLRCTACHRRGEAGPAPARELWFASASEMDLGPEGRLPPPLGGVGAKLRLSALHDMVRGADPVRPYLRARMPDFGPELAAWLAPRLARADRRSDEPKVERRGRNPWGRHLIGTDGLSCVVCHGLAGRRSLGIPALDLATVPRRLRVEWFHQYMIDPARFRSGTRMPTFWPEGKAALRTYLGGNTRVQIDSLWVYLMELDQGRLPAGLEEAGSFELRPRERPTVFRTFLEEVGAHAIAVGFPAGVHYAFDGLSPHSALVWSGRFLDAEGTWDDRFAPFAAPLGKDVRSLPGGPVLARLHTLNDPWPERAADGTRAERFQGYRLDRDGVPTFLYRVADVTVEERLVPLDSQERGRGFERVLTFRSGKGTVWLRLLVSPVLQRGEKGVWKAADGVAVKLPDPATHALARERSSGGAFELLLPIDLDAALPQRLVMEWTW